MPHDRYSLLAAEPCNQPLPEASVVDSFEYARFAPLEVVRRRGGNEIREVAIFPADRAVPLYVASLKRQGWFDKRIRFERGGLPLIRTWDPPDPRADPGEPVAIDVESPTGFIANPVARFGRRSATVSLTADHVRELAGYGRTLITDPEGRRPPVVVNARQGVNPAAPSAAIELPVARDAFLANPVVSLAGNRVRLAEAQIRELLETGNTVVEMRARRAGGGAVGPAGQAPVLPTSFRIVAVQTPSIGAGVMRSTMIIRPPRGTDSIIATDDYRAAHPPRTLEPADVSLPDLVFPFVLYLPYRQEWTLLGYARGELLNSIPLAPEEETTIEVFSWDRRKVEESTSITEEREFTYEVRASRKETAEVVNEAQRIKDWKLTAGGKIGLPPIKGITLEGEIRNETSTQIQNMNRTTIGTIAEATAMASAKLKVTKQTKITETVETGVETRVTRKIRNGNRCRTLTYDFFEVLANYRISTRSRPEALRLAVLLPDPFAQPITRDFVLMHYGTIRRALLDPDLEGGLEAARWLAAREEWCTHHCSKSCECEEEKKQSGGETGAVGGLRGVQISASGPESTPTDLEAGIGRVLGSIAALRAAGWKSLERAFETAAPDAEFEDAVLEYRRWVYRTFGLNWFNPGFWAACILYERDAATDKSSARLERLLASAESAWIEELLRGVFITSLYGLVLPIMAIELLGMVGLVNAIRFTDRFGLDDAGLGVHLSQAREAVDRDKNAKEAQATIGSGQTDSTPTALEEAVTEGVARPPEPYPMEELGRHTVALRALLAHLEQNRYHYRTAIWQAMSPGDRAARLSLWGELGDMLDNEVLGFVDDKVAVPFQSWRIDGLAEVLENIANRIVARERPVEQEVTLPTPGIVIQGRLGECDLCEPYIVKHRRLDIEDRRHAVALAEQKARLKALEADRREARLKAKPPILKPFDEAPDK